MRCAAVVLWLTACVPISVTPNGQVVPAPELPPIVTISEANRAFMADLHQRMTGNATLPDVEAVMCVFGSIKGNHISVERFAATRILYRDSVSATYIACEGKDLLGAWHTHPKRPGNTDCAFSDPDMASFKRSGNILTMVSCDNGNRVMIRVKRGYSR